MYKTIVNTRKINDLTGLYPLIIWMVFVFNSLIAMAVTYFAVLFLFIGFLGLIPTLYFPFKYKKLISKREIGYIRKEITFNVKNRELYVNDKKLRISQNKLTKEIYVDDTVVQNISGRTFVIPVTFAGIIEAPYINDFEKFLKEQGVEIIQE